MPPSRPELPADGPDFMSRWGALRDARTLYVEGGFPAAFGRDAYRISTDPGDLESPGDWLAPLGGLSKLLEESGGQQFTFGSPGHALTRFELARIAGMLESPDPEATGPGRDHGLYISVALRDDRPYALLHHAMCVREAGAPSAEWRLPLADACITLGLVAEAEAELSAAAQADSSDPARVILAARLATLTGNPKGAMAAVEPLRGDSRFDAAARRETARALMIMGREPSARMELGLALQSDPQDLDTQLLMGVSLRNQHFEAGNREGLDHARGWLQLVIDRGGYRAAEALHHMATVFLGAGDMKQAEAAARLALQERERSVVRRNLILALHAQGKMAEMQEALDVLRQRSPDVADELAKSLG